RAFIRSAQIPKPQLHTLAQVQSNAVGYAGLKAPANGLPDIFFILQESTPHPSIIGSDKQPKTLYGPVTDASHLTGKLHVHTFAGGTWRSEFAMTTQMRPQEFGNDGLYVFHQLEGRINRSVFTMLKTLGYRTMVIYSVPGNFINARGFYTSIGVDEFYDPMTLGLSGTWDWKTPDSVYYNAMLEKIKDSKQPVAVMLLTISQHGPHEYTDPVNDFMTRFARADQDYADLLAALKKRGKPAGVVAFGDHQPEFMTRFTEDRKLWYYTTYDMRCVNFACAQTPAGKHTDKSLDIVLLPSLALEEFGFGLDDFSALQRVTFKGCEENIETCDEQARLAFNGAFQQFFVQ
ncbi:MAG: sulfatase-like hydrolase/transferase, partial [Rhodospirillaceae bacterium]|nr:sulfatase-like hydrolase/transferase [Rhodospirillaceae bacterium]